MRDLARKRMFLVRHRTAHKLSLQSLIRRCCAYHVNANEMRTLTDQDLQHWFKDEHLLLTAQASLNSIKFFNQQVKQIEKVIINKVKLKKSFQYLKTVPGIGDILALIIMLEVGDISRFAKDGNFAS